MSIRHLRERIIQGIESSDKTESSRYRHHQTALNMLLKTSIVLSEDELEQALSVNLSETIEKLKMTLERQGKSDTRSPLTRVRRLAEFYAEINNIDFSRMTFVRLWQQQYRGNTVSVSGSMRSPLRRRIILRKTILHTEK